MTIMTHPVSPEMAEDLAKYAEDGDLSSLQCYWIGWLTARANGLVAQLKAAERTGRLSDVYLTAADFAAKHAAEDAEYAVAVRRARDVRFAQQQMALAVAR